MSADVVTKVEGSSTALSSTTTLTPPVVATAVPVPAFATHTEPKRTTLDWTLPPSFLALLSTPLNTAINSLLPPAPAHPPTAASAPASGKDDVPAPKHPFLDAMKNTADALTEKGGHAFASTESALVDLFFELTPSISLSKLRELLDKAWIEDPTATVKIILQARSIHEGKGYKEGWWMAMGWLWEKHARTMLANLHLLVDPTCERPRSKSRARKAAKKVAEDGGVVSLDDDGEVESPLDELPEYPPRPHGCFDDLVDLLVLHLNGELDASYEDEPKAVDEALVPAYLGSVFRNARKYKDGKINGQKRDRSGFVRMGLEAKKLVKESFKYKLLKAGSKKGKHELLHGRLEAALSKDKAFQALYLTVLDLFETQLKADLDQLDEHKTFLTFPEEQRKPFRADSSPHLWNMSFAAKWVPTPAHGADRQLHFASALALELFPGEDVLVARERLQREVLSPLRKVTKVPEVDMVHGEWKIDYTKVPSRAMSRYAEHFMLHDPKGYERYLTKVAEGKLSISGASLFPHEILIEALSSSNDVIKRLADLQWKSLVDSIASSANSKFENCLAIADVSGSMGYYGHGDKKNPQPINVCLALTLLLGELASAPWNGCFFTFSSDPACQFVDPSKPLSERAAKVQESHWEMSTNFYKVFDLILATAKREKLSPENMVKKLFIFSDMQFDEAVDRQEGETEHRTIKRKFEEAGYTLPELVYWNLAARGGGTAKPARADEESVALVSGYSGALMKYFLGQQAEQEDEELAEEMQADWEKVDEEEESEEGNEGNEGNEVKGTKRKNGDGDEDEGEAKKKKKKKNPLEVVRGIIGAKSFEGVVLVD